MTFRHQYFDSLSPADQQRALDEIDRVMRAVFDLGQDGDPAELKKLFAMLKPEARGELEYVSIDEAA